MATAIAVVPAAAASAATFPNACKNSVTANNSQVGVTMTAAVPASVGTGGLVTLSNIQQSVSVPGGIFVAGYNLGLLDAGENTIPSDVTTQIAASNTVEATQTTNTVASSIVTTISDPDGSPSTGDESASEGTLVATYADQTWHAAASPGTIGFREETIQPLGTGTAALHKGGVKISALVGGVLPVRFACSPGTVAGPDPGTITFNDPADSFSSTEIVESVASELDFGKVKLNKKKGTAKLTVEVSGAGEVSLAKSSTVKGDSAQASGAGKVKLDIKAIGKAKKKLNKKGKVKVKVKATFSPTTGDPVTKTKTVKLVKK